MSTSAAAGCGSPVRGEAAPGAARCRCRRGDPDLPVGRAARHRQYAAVRGREGTAPRPAADGSWAADHLPLPPGESRRASWASARAAAHLRYLSCLEANEARLLRRPPATCLTSIRNLSAPVVTFAT